MMRELKNETKQNDNRLRVPSFKRKKQVFNS